MFFPSLFCLAQNYQHDLFLRDKPHLLSEIRRATHYGTTPDKQEVDDLRSEVGSLRLQVTDMDHRIETLSRMVDHLLEERSAALGVSDSFGAKSNGIVAKHEIPSVAGSAKRRRLDEEMDGAEPAASEDFRESSPSRVKVEGVEESAGMEGRDDGREMMRVKEEAVESSVYPLLRSVSRDNGGVSSDGDSDDGMIIGGGPLCRDSSFLRDLDEMNMGSPASMITGGGSLGPLELVDMTACDEVEDNDDCDLDSLEEELLSIDFATGVTPIAGSKCDVVKPCKQSSLALDQPLKQGPVEWSQGASGASSPGMRYAPMQGFVSCEEHSRFKALTASLEAMPADSKFKLAEGLLALAQSSRMGAALASASGGGGVPAPLLAPTNSGARGVATEPPEIAIPLASAAIGAFAEYLAQAQAVQEPANAVAAVAIDASRRALERTASLR